MNSFICLSLRFLVRRLDALSWALDGLANKFDDDYLWPNRITVTVKSYDSSATKINLKNDSQE